MSEHIIIQPVLTEKISKLTQKSNNTQYAFIVAKDANKVEIKNAIENKFGATIKNLRTSIVAPKSRHRYTKTSIISGKSKGYKKAFVTFSAPIELEFLTTNNSTEE